MSPAARGRVPHGGPWAAQGASHRRPAAKGTGSRRGFGATWWGRAWVDALEGRARLDPNRLPRGRSYARSGAVGELVVTAGEVAASVQGSRRRPYDVRVRIRQYDAAEWDRLLDAIAGRVGHAAALLTVSCRPRWSRMRPARRGSPGDLAQGSGGPAPDSGVPAREVWSRTADPLPAVPLVPLPPARPGRPAPLAVDPPADAGVDLAGLALLAADAAARAHALALGEGDGCLGLDADADLARRDLGARRRGARARSPDAGFRSADIAQPRHPGPPPTAPGAGPALASLPQGRRDVGTRRCGRPRSRSHRSDLL